MGLSSSQARLLSLTGRMHQIEYRAQKIEAEKLQLANESRHVYQDYLNALEMTKIQNKSLTSDCSATFTDTTFNNFIGSMAGNNSIYILRDLESGKVYVPNDVRNAYENSNKTAEGFLQTVNSTVADKQPLTSITNAQQLLSLSNSSGNFKLDADIELENWEGIVNFSGTFDGNGHKITIKNSTEGLFFNINGGTVRNVEVDADITNYNRSRYLGGLASAINNGTIENCSVTGNINGNRWIGGICGYAYGNTTITNTTASANISSDVVDDGTDLHVSESYAGGFIGGSTGTLNVTNCRAEGNVSSEYEVVGGFIGEVQGSANFTRCVSTGTIEANRSGLGNVNSYDYSYVHHNARDVLPSGTFIAQYYLSSNINIQDCYAYGLPVNENGTVDVNYNDFGVNYSGDSGASVIDSYSAYVDEIATPDLLSEMISASDVDRSLYPNIPADKIDYYVTMFNLMNRTHGGLSVPEDMKNDVQWFRNMVIGAYAMISTVDISKGYLIDDTSVATDTNLQEVEDNSLIRKAEAKYEANMRRIDMKDRKYDYDLAAIEQERNAIKQEMETLKTVAKDNVERTFKLFS